MIRSRDGTAHTRSSDIPPVRIDPDDERAWCGEQRLDLPPKTFAVLRHLVEHADRLLTKDELMSAVWGETIVSEASLTSCIRDLRRALADSSRTPRYIETAHRRGFRFIGPIAGTRDPAGQIRSFASDVLPLPSLPPAASRTPTLVGREAELARLDELLQAALDGRRKLVFIVGEAGIGKTTLLDAFLARLQEGELLVARGQCVEQFGAGETHLPILEALGRLGRERGGERLVRILRQFAPTWLAQLPALLDDSDLEMVRRRAQGTTRDRMLRELTEALDVLSNEAPLVLVLEDLHWSDSGTVDLLAMIARRRDPARLLILGTYRPAEVAAGAHPLKPVKQELQVHGQCEELALEFLSEAEVADYLHRRFPRASFAPRFTRLLHEASGGNPLFLVNVIDDLIGQGHLAEVDGEWALTAPLDVVGSSVPGTLSQMVERQFERLAPREQAMLALGSAAGEEFSAALSVVAGIEVEEGERCCDGLARRGQLLSAVGTVEWPDGTVTGRYRFIHAIYRNALYARVPIGQRIGLHLRIGERLERAQGARALEAAGELAMHFEHGRDFERAARYHRHAAESVLRQHGYSEAVQHATRALELLEALPESPEQSHQALLAQTVLGAALIATRGWNAPDVAQAYESARILCTRIGSTPHLFPVLLGLSAYYLMRGELGVGEETVRQLLQLAESTGDRVARLGAHNMAGLMAFYRGQLVAALAHFEEAGALYDPEEHSPNRLSELSVDHDIGVSCMAHTALTQLLLGYPDRAAASMRKCLGYAHTIDHPLSLVMALNFAAFLHHVRRDRSALEEIENERHALATAHGFELFLWFGDIFGGWLTAEAGRGEDGVVQIRRGLEIYRFVGGALGAPTFFAILAEAYGGVGRLDEGRAAVEEGLAVAEQTGFHYWDAELLRRKAELAPASAGAAATRAAPVAKTAEASLLAAIEIARSQEARLLELRAATSLSRLWRRRGRADDARSLLSGIHAWFSEGFETPDFREAKAILDEIDGDRPSKPRARSR